MACLVTVLGLAGCEKEGSAEKAGKKIDYAKENVEQKIEQTTEKADKKVTEAKRSLSQLADKAGESIDKSTDASKDDVRKCRTKNGSGRRECRKRSLKAQRSRSLINPKKLENSSMTRSLP